MKISRQELTEALSIVKPGIASKDIIEQSTSFAFLEGRVVTYNDEISISHPIAGIDFEGAVKAEELYGLLSKLSKDEVTLTIEDDHELKVTCGRVKAGLKMESKIQIPIKDIPETFKKIKDPQGFIKGLSMTRQACSNDMSEAKLVSVSLYPDGMMIGSDGYRLIKFQGQKLPIKDNLLIPSTSCAELVKIKPIKIALDKGWIFAENKAGTVFAARYLDDTYIPLESINNIMKTKTKEVINFPDEIADILSRVSQFAKRKYILDEAVSIEISKGKIVLKAQSEDTGSWVEEKAKIDTNADLEFELTPSLFNDILKMTKTCELDESLTKVKFLGESWEYVIMLKKR
jgi:DNA polymerase III sliding clamp (beta) subunit (PCNA family)